MQRLFQVLLAFALLGSPAVARDSKRISPAPTPSHPWYLKNPKPATLKAALVEEREFLGRDNPGYRMIAGKELCAALAKVGLGCDYNTRSSLSMFLTVNRKGIFPASGGTNPYMNESIEEGCPDDTYIGTAKQNRMLTEAVRRNAKLFKRGDLSAESVRKAWH